MEHWPKGYDLVVLDEVDSTMDEAARRAPDLTRPTWIMAHRQTGARGRLGRPWTQTQDNLAASLVLFPDETAKVAVWRTFMAAVALAETFRRCGVMSDRIKTKWPNDVLLDGGKVAGILLESEVNADRIKRLTIGFGVNLGFAPPPDARAKFPPVCLSEAAGIEMTPEAFLGRLAGVVAAWEARFKADGFYPIRTAWEKQTAHRGAITVRDGKRTLHGQFVDLDEQGRLVVHTKRGLHHVAAGDISFDI